MEANTRPKTQYSERTQISLSKEEKAEIDAVKAALGISMSEVIRRGVHLLLGNMRRDKRFTQAVLAQTAGSWEGREEGIEYQRRIRQEEESRRKRSGLA